MMDKFLTKIADTQAFGPDDKLGKMIEDYDSDELSEDNLDLVFAARKDDADFGAFLRMLEEKEGK